MIKRLGNILLICTVLSATTGFVVNKHYMNGELFSTSVYSNPETCCLESDFCGCCHEESAVVKMDNSFLTSNQQHLKIIQHPLRHILNNTILFDPPVQTATPYPVKRLPYPRVAIHKWLQSLLL